MGMVCLCSAWFQLGLLRWELGDPLLRRFTHTAGKLEPALAGSPAGFVGWSFSTWLSPWAAPVPSSNLDFLRNS